MSKSRSKTPDYYIEIQPIIHKEIQPIITTNVQPIINQKIQPVIHKDIQPIIHQEIQPVITTEIQPIIHKKIQPVIFMENQTNIEEVIQKLQKSSPRPYISKEEHITEKEIEPITKNEVKTIDKIVVQPYIQRVEQHVTRKEIAPKTEKKERVEEIIEYVPYIQYKNGEILPYEKKERNTIKIGYKKEDNDTYISSKMMEGIIAVNFVSLDKNISFPMACRKKDIFSKIVKKLYHEFPTLKSKKIYFVANGNVVNSSYTLEQNKIENGNTILINESE